MDTATFYIGQEPTQFVIPRIVIEPNTFLGKYLSSSFKKEVYEDGYLLQNEDVDLFQSFYQFLLGGDFPWNKEVADYFDFMGYHNTLNFPLDYWKIKLRDNWIRDNFYRLELWNEKRNQDNDLLITRGPYVGLVEIDFLYPKLAGMFFQRSVYQNLPNLADYSSGDIVLAGGALNSILSNDPHEINDYDFFITTKDPQRGLKQIKDLIKRVEWLKIVRTANAITIKVNQPRQPKRQIVLRLYTCPSEVVHGFDLDASGFVYDGQRIWGTLRAEYSLKTKINFFDPSRMSPTYAYRLAKYASRGFNVWLPDFDWNKVNMHILNSTNGRTMSNIEDEAGGFSDVSMALDCFPKRIPTGWYMDILKNQPLTLSIYKKRVPIDMILFASYFHYIPKLMVSDYESSKTGEYKTKHVKDKGDGWWFYSGKGYVTFVKNPGTQVPIEKILDLTGNAIALSSGLSPEIEWKSQNPMEQLSGTFNPSKVTESWYKDSVLYS